MLQCLPQVRPYTDREPGAQRHHDLKSPLLLATLTLNQGCTVYQCLIQIKYKGLVPSDLPDLHRFFFDFVLGGKGTKLDKRQQVQ